MTRPILLLLLLNTIAFAQQSGEIVRCDIDMPYRASNLRPSAVLIKTIRKTPAVINPNAVNFLLEAILNGTPSSIEFEFDGSTNRTKLLDNGTGGDKVANDGVYSLTINKPSAGWDHNKVLGYIYVFENGVQQVKYNFFTEVRTVDMPTPSIKKINDKIQFTDYIFNITDDIGSKNFANEVALAKEFYKYHRDDFDFLNFILVPGYTDNRFHSSLRNSVQGIGQNIINGADQYGSASRLKGFNYAPQLSIFNGIDNGFNHETGHQWINYAKTSFLKDGVPHMPASNIANGVMGISIGGAGGQGGEFRYNFLEEGTSYRLTTQSSTNTGIFNDWELYLMGLIPASEVKNQAIVFKDQSKYPTNFVYPKTDFNIYTINDYISQMGSRLPDFTQSQKQFTMATIVVSEKLLSEDEMAYLNHNLKRAETNVAVEIRSGLTMTLAKPFRLATGDRATMRTLLNTNVNCATVPAKPSIVSTTNFKFCDGSQAELSVNLNAGEQAIWYYRGVPLDDKTNKITAKETTGGYSVSVRRTGDGCNSIESNEVKLIKAALPNVTQLQSSNGTEIDYGKTTVVSTTASTGLSYQWFKDNNPITNATNSSFTVNESGNYSLKVSNSDGCTATSNAIQITIKPQILGLNIEETNQKIRLFPNPVEDILILEIFSNKTSKVNLSIVNEEGKLLNKSSDVLLQVGWNNTKFNTQALSAGVYYILVEEAEKKYSKKFIKL